MYIRITKNNKGDAYFHLVESFRQDGKVKQRILLSLGRVEDNKLEQLSGAISKHLDSIHVLDLAKHIDINNAYIYGSLMVLDRLMETLGINSVISVIATTHEKLSYDLKKILFTLITSRFVKPVSKLALYDRWIEKFYPVMVDHDIALQHIYRSLDILAGHKEQIEQSLYEYKKDLFSINIDIVLYDLTTLRFESTREDLGDLRKFGYSKEMRTDCTQVVFGLLTDTDGIPLSFEVHPGNTFEGNTLKDIVDKMRKKFSVRRFIFVADRGLFSAKNLEHIRNNQGEFIVGLKIGVLQKQLQQTFYDISRFEFISEELAIWETQYGEDRCIVTWSKSRAERDRKTRDDILAKIREKLGKKNSRAKTFVTNSNYQKYLIIQDGATPVLNQQAIDEQARKDGFFGIITNVKNMSAKEIVFNYKQLWKIEDSFGELKGSLRSRPVFHWTDDRIIGHLVVCFLAYLCEAHMTKVLREQNDNLQSKAIKEKIIKARPLTAVIAMEELNSVLAIPVKIKSQTIWVRTDIPENAQNLLKAMNIRIPPKILEKR
jgi:transposase